MDHYITAFLTADKALYRRDIDKKMAHIRKMPIYGLESYRKRYPKELLDECKKEIQSKGIDDLMQDKQQVLKSIDEDWNELFFATQKPTEEFVNQLLFRHWLLKAHTSTIRSKQRRAKMGNENIFGKAQEMPND